MRKKAKKLRATNKHWNAKTTKPGSFAKDGEKMMKKLFDACLTHPILPPIEITLEPRKAAVRRKMK